MMKKLIACVLVTGVGVTAGCSAEPAETGEVAQEETVQSEAEAQPEKESVDEPEEADLYEPPVVEPQAYGDTAEEAYQKVLDEYKDAYADASYDHMSEDYLERNVEFSEYYINAYPDVSRAILEMGLPYRTADYYGESAFTTLYYSYYDINKDGQDELLIGIEDYYEDEYGGVHGEKEDFITYAIYTYDGEKAVNAVNGDEFYGSGIQFIEEILIYDNGCIVRDYYGDDDGGCNFYKIDSDGYTVIQTDAYWNDWEPDDPNMDIPAYASGRGDDEIILSGEEFDELYQERTGATDLILPEWAELISRQDVSGAEAESEESEDSALQGLFELIRSDWEEEDGIIRFSSEDGVNWVVSKKHAGEIICEEHGFYGTETGDGYSEGYFILPFQTHVSAENTENKLTDCDLWGYYTVPCDGVDENGKLIEPYWPGLERGELYYTNRDEMLEDIKNNFEGIIE